MFGAVTFSYMNTFSTNPPIVQGKLISIFVSLGSYTFFSILYIITIRSCNDDKSKQQNISSCILLILLKCVDFFSAFALTWILISLYATLLYSLAYPIYVIILVTLHVTIFIVTIIIFAVFVPNVISCWNKCTDMKILRYIFICCTSIGFVVLVVGVCAIYVAVIYAYGSTIVEQIFPQDGLVQALLLLPSLFVFVGAWLLQRNVFGK